MTPQKKNKVRAKKMNKTKRKGLNLKNSNRKKLPLLRLRQLRTKKGFKLTTRETHLLNLTEERTKIGVIKKVLPTKGVSPKLLDSKVNKTPKTIRSLKAWQKNSYEIEEDKNAKKWMVRPGAGSQGTSNQGTWCVECDSRAAADEYRNELSEGRAYPPTESPTGYKPLRKDTNGKRTIYSRF